MTPFKQGMPSGVQHSEQVVMRQLKTVYRSEAQALQQHAGCPVVCSGELLSPAAWPQELLLNMLGARWSAQVRCLKLALRLATWPQ